LGLAIGLYNATAQHGVP